MQDLSIFTPIIGNYESKGIIFSFDERVVAHKNRSRLRKKIALVKGKQGMNQEEIENILINPYNDLVREQAISEIETEIAAEQENALLASQATAKELADLREQLDNQAKENAAKTAASELERTAPVKKFTAWLAVSMIISLVALLFGLNNANARYFLGDTIGVVYCFIFAFIFSIGIVYFALVGEARQTKFLIGVIVGDLIIATLLKPAIGPDLHLALEGTNVFNKVGGYIGLLTFLGIYCYQIFHTAQNAIGFLSSSEINAKDAFNSLLKR